MRVQQFDKRYIAAAVALLIATAVGIGSYYGLFDRFGSFGRFDPAATESPQIASSRPVAERIMALLEGRSPGERTAGELAATKLRLASLRGIPKQRALGKIRQPKPTLPQEFVDAIAPVLPAPVEVVPAVTAPPSLAEVLTPQPASVVPIGGILIPPVGGGGSPGGGGVIPEIPPTPVPEVPPAVPEPSTWLMMLIGFGAIGWSMRRRQKPPLAALSIT